MKRILLSFLILLTIMIPVHAEKQRLNWWIIPGGQPPEMSDTGYRLTPNHAIVCTIHVPEYRWWSADDYYGGGVGVRGGSQDIRVYAFVDREPFMAYARLGIWHGRSDRINAVDMPRFDMDVQVCISYLSDGTIKIAYRYGILTDWRILHTEVATSSEYTVIAVNAHDFHVYSLSSPVTTTPQPTNPTQTNPNSPEYNQPPTNPAPEPFPTAQPFPGSQNSIDTNTLMLAGLGIVGLIALLAISRR